MEEEKKKRNKKKKNKQNKTTTDDSAAATGIGESTIGYQNHVHQSDLSHESDNGSVQNDAAAASERDMGIDRSHANGKQEFILADADKQFWLDREATLREIIRKLQMEKDVLIQKEDSLDKITKQLQKEKELHVQKEASFNEQIKQLHKERNIHNEQEALLEVKISQMQIEKNSWHEKEVSLEEKVKQLERERDSCIQKENWTSETTSSLNNNNTALQAKVLELEASRDNLLQENHQLTENIYILRSQIQNLERSNASHSSIKGKGTVHSYKNGNIDSQMEAAGPLIEKLINENAELIEKVNELYVELYRKGRTTEQSSYVEGPLTIGTTEFTGVAENSSHEYNPSVANSERLETSYVADPMFKSGNMFVSDDELKPGEGMIDHEENGIGSMNASRDATVIINLPEIIETEEIVQIPLDESEIDDKDLKAAHNEEKDDVLLTDAPLIGAPFRFVSFVARYVSGADLVNKSSANSCH